MAGVNKRAKAAPAYCPVHSRSLSSASSTPYCWHCTLFSYHLPTSSIEQRSGRPSMSALNISEFLLHLRQVVSDLQSRARRWIRNDLTPMIQSNSTPTVVETGRRLQAVQTHLDIQILPHLMQSFHVWLVVALEPIVMMYFTAQTSSVIAWQRTWCRFPRFETMSNCCETLCATALRPQSTICEESQVIANGILVVAARSWWGILVGKLEVIDNWVVILAVSYLGVSTKTACSSPGRNRPWSSPQSCR